MAVGQFAFPWQPDRSGGDEDGDTSRPRRDNMSSDSQLSITEMIQTKPRTIRQIRRAPSWTARDE